MPPTGHDPAWPDKQMFAAILLILAAAVGLAFLAVKPLMTISEDGLPTVFADEIPGYTAILCTATLAFAIAALWRQAAVFTYLGAACAIASLAVYGLVPALGVLAIAAMAKSHLEGEETHDDGVELAASRWPDKALAASLFILVVAAIAITQAFLLLGERLTALVWDDQPRLAGAIGLAIGLVGLVASREVYHLRRPWLGWIALALGFATLGFYLIGPVLAVVGFVLLGLAHREKEFLIHGNAEVAEALEATAALAAKPRPVRRRGRGRRPAAT